MKDSIIITFPNTGIYEMFLCTVCPAGFVQLVTGCYRVREDTLRTWNEAEADCRKFGAALIIIENSVEQHAIAQLLEASNGAYV